MKGERLSYQMASSGQHRRWIKRIVLSLIFAVAMSIWSTGAAASNVNVIANPGFESGSMGQWVIGGDWCGISGDGPCSPWQISSTDSHGGSFSLEDMGDVEVVQYFALTMGSDVSSASFWLKQDPSMMFGYELFYLGGAESFNVVMPDGNGWQEYDITSSIDPNGLLYGIGFVNYSGNVADSNGPAWLDDVVIDSTFAPMQTPEPTALELVIGGLACMAISGKSALTIRRGPMRLIGGPREQIS